MWERGAEKEKLVRLASELCLDNVEFIDQVQRAQVPDIYSAADLCLVPLRKTELFRGVLPSKMFEIMSMERPVLVSVDGVAREEIERAGAGVYVEPESAEQIARVIEELSENSSLCTQYGNNGRVYVEKHYNRVALAEFYQSLLQGFAPEGPKQPTSNRATGS